MTTDVEEIVVVGAGGHGKVVADALVASGRRVTGFLDDAKPLGTLVLGLPVLGATDWLRGRSAMAALGVGDNAARERAATMCRTLGVQLVTVVHPRAVVATSARVDDGAVILALAVVNPDAVIGEGAIVNTAAVIEHDCFVAPFSHVSPNASVAGGCHVGRRAHLGVGAAMLPLTRVGDDTIVGGGALVARDLPAGIVASGVPARFRRGR